MARPPRVEYAKTVLQDLFQGTRSEGGKERAGVHGLRRARYTLKEIGEHPRLHYSTVNKMIRQEQERRKLAYQDLTPIWALRGRAEGSTMCHVEG